MVRRQKIHYAEQGFSLLEMMASVIIMSIVVGGIFSLVTRNQMFGKNESESSEVVQNARAAFEMMTREVRGAGVGSPAKQAFVAANPTSLTVRGTFPKISAVATAVDATTGVFTAAPITNFAKGQRVLLEDPNSGAAAYSSITNVDAVSGQLTVATTISNNVTDMWAIPAGAATTTSSFCAGTAISVVQCITYQLTSDGQLMRSVAPEYGATTTESSAIATNILTLNGEKGISFKYYQSNGAETVTSNSSPTPPTSLANISLLGINLTVRSRNRSLFSKEYQTFNLTTEARPRG